MKSYTQNSKTYLNILYEGIITTYVTTSTHLRCHLCSINKKITSNYLCSHVLSVLQLLSITSGSRYIFAVKQNFTHIERNLYCQIFYITCRLILLIHFPSVVRMPAVSIYNPSGFNSYTTTANHCSVRVVVTHQCHYFVVPLGDSASISMLSYSQRHYDIYFLLPYIHYQGYQNLSAATSPFV